jgi:ABC-type transport system involved in cytochrome bd biosynthesis fused ATPase/permease subunit
VLEGRTSFVIAHRLSTIRAADRIVVIVDGKIAEEGSHEELLALRGRYFDLYVQQSLRDSARTEGLWRTRSRAPGGTLVSPGAAPVT